MAKSLGRKAVSGTLWTTADRLVSMVLQFAVNLVLAWVLVPEDYGVVGVLAIFIAISNTLIDGGFASALIQHKNPTQEDYSTIFFWNFGFSILCYLILFLISPLVALFFRLPVLESVLRVIGLGLIASALGQVQIVRLKKNLEFGTIAVVNLTSYIFAAAIGVYMAYHGFAYWSLVAMTVANQAVMTLLYWIVAKWRPSLKFSVRSFRMLFNYGGYLLAAGFLQEACKHLQGVIIGKRFSESQLGLYTQASKLDQVTSYAIPQVLVQVLFPLFSTLQDEKERLREMMEIGIRVIAAVVFPLLILLIIVADPLVLALYHEPWLPCVPYFRILCFGGVFACLQNINFYAVAACGYSRVLFRWSFYKWGMLVALMLVGMFFGMRGLMWSIVISNLNIYAVNAALARKYVGFSLLRQFRAVLPPLMAGAVPAVIVFCLDVDWLVEAIIYAAIYVAIVFLTRMRVVKDIKFIISRFMNKK